MLSNRTAFGLTKFLCKTSITKMPFYAVAKGKPTGIFSTWAECQQAVKGVKHAKFKKFDTETEAQDFINMFKGKHIPSTSMQILQSPPQSLENNEDFSPEIFSADVDNELAEDLLATHLNNLENICESFKEETFNAIKQIDELSNNYKKKLISEFSDYQQKLLCIKKSDNVIPVRHYSTIKLETAGTKRKLSDENKPKKKLKVPLPIDNDGFVHVFTDGACENNGKVNSKAGLGVWFGDNHPLNVGEPVKGRATNNVGEIQACTRAIKIAHENGVKKLCINTDSQFVINSMTTWLDGWKKRDWKLKDGGPVKNKYDFVDLDKACELLEVKWNYVKGHAGIEGNEGADFLARQGAQMY